MPSGLVLVGHSVPRSRSLATTVAPTIAEFDGSVTRPVMPALISWDIKGTEHRVIPAQRSERSFFIKTTFRKVSLQKLYINCRPGGSRSPWDELMGRFRAGGCSAAASSGGWTGRLGPIDL